MATIQRPFNLNQWIEENRHLFKPPVGNRTIYEQAGTFIVMIVGGPNSRKDFHFNESEELFYQLKGDIVLKIKEAGKIVDITVREGDIFLLPARIPHSPQRGADTLGLVVEKIRSKDELDGFMWFCENCSETLHQEYLYVADIVTQLPPVMKGFYSDIDKRTCKKCGSVLVPPQAPVAE